MLETGSWKLTLWKLASPETSYGVFSFAVTTQACGLLAWSAPSCPVFRSFPGIQLFRLASFASVVGVRGRAVGVEGRSFAGDAGRETG